MTTRIKNGIGLRAELEARNPAIGANTFGSYVLRSFDPGEYDHVLNLDWGKLSFGKEEYVVVAKGTQGSIARLAKVTADHRYASLLCKFISVALTQGEVQSKSAFIRSIANNVTLLVEHGGKEYVGVLHGDIGKNYKTLVYPSGDRFNFLDLEENPPPQSSHMRVRIKETNPSAGVSVKADLLLRFS